MAAFTGFVQAHPSQKARANDHAMFPSSWCPQDEILATWLQLSCVLTCSDSCLAAFSAPPWSGVGAAAEEVAAVSAWPSARAFADVQTSDEKLQ